MQKIIAKTSLIIFFASNIAPWFSYAQTTPASCPSNPSICQMTPATLTDYLDFQYAMIRLLATDPFTTITDSISAPNWGLFTHQILKLPQEDTLANNLLAQNIDQISEATAKILMSNLTATLLFELTALTTATDGIMSFAILLEERPIVRDRAKLLDIERTLSTTAYNLGKNLKIWKRIEKTDAANDILTTFKEKKLFTSDAHFPNGIKYEDLIAQLIQLNMKLKVFLAYNTTAQFTKDNNEYLQFSPDRISKIADDYHCVRFSLENKCSQAGETFAGNINTLASNTKTSGTTAIKTINSARDRLLTAINGLKNIRKQGSSWVSEYEKELLKNRGFDPDQQLWGGLFNIRQSTKNQRKEVANTSSTRRGELKAGRNIAKRSMEEAKEKSRLLEEQQAKEKELRQAETKNTTIKTQTSQKPISASQKVIEMQQKYISDFITLHENQDLYEELKNELSKLIEHHQILLLKTSFTETSELTQKFGLLAMKIQDIHTTIGNKNSGLRQTLNNQCSYQCKNKPQLECYTK